MSDDVKRSGTWVPESVALRLVGAKIKPASVWPVLLVVVLTQCRFGGRGKFAYLPVQRIVTMTGLSPATVHRAIKRLRQKDLVRRVGRRGKLVCSLIEDVGARCRVAENNADDGSEAFVPPKISLHPRQT